MNLINALFYAKLQSSNKLSCIYQQRFLLRIKNTNEMLNILNKSTLNYYFYII